MNANPPQPSTLSGSSTCGALVLALALYLDPGAVHAQEVYKSIDAQGHVVFSDRSDTAGAEKLVLPVDQVQSAPKVLHFCWTNCFTLEGADGVYKRTDGTDESWTVERFTRDSFVLHRHDAPAAWNGFHADVTYAGAVANDRMINVTVDGRPSSDIQMAWGSALNKLPGSNAERDRPSAKAPLPQASAPVPSERVEPEVTASEAPPPLRDEAQPACAVVGSIWTPGYWAWAGGYTWVWGAWVLPPRVGVLWTPGYWTFVGAVYVYHPGHWGPRVGYYGGINYGYGYFGSGYAGGRWVGTTFAYNTAVSNVNTNVIRDTYREPMHAAVAASKRSYHVESRGGTPVATAPGRVAADSAAHSEPPSLHSKAAPATAARANASAAGAR